MALKLGGLTPQIPLLQPDRRDNLSFVSNFVLERINCIKTYHVLIGERIMKGDRNSKI